MPARLSMMGKITPQQVQDLLRDYHLDHDGHIQIESVGATSARARFKVAKKHLRPGDTVSGPTLMALADVAMYAALLGEIGLVPLAVTTSLNINFLRKPPQKDVYGDAKLLKVGKRLAVGEVTLYSEGETEPIAHVTCTYSIPPRKPDAGR
ncbi:MAG: PaaI family thioesterase [Betaproteobacteria bacterium]